MIGSANRTDFQALFDGKMRKQRSSILFIREKMSLSGTLRHNKTETVRYQRIAPATDDA
jgi:hypothetical protein